MIALGSPRPHRGPRRPAEAGDLPAVEALLAAGADPMAADVGGWTPLMVAAQNGHAEALRQLAGRPPPTFLWARMDVCNVAFVKIYTVF